MNTGDWINLLGMFYNATTPIYRDYRDRAEDIITGNSIVVATIPSKNLRYGNAGINAPLCRKGMFLFLGIPTRSTFTMRTHLLFGTVITQLESIAAAGSQKSKTPKPRKSCVKKKPDTTNENDAEHTSYE